MNETRRKKEPPKNHVCPKCGSAFNRPYRLRQHEKIHENIKQFVCGELNCNKSYTNKSHLDRHIFSAHQEPPVNVIYSCPQCMKVYVNRQNLKRHINTHHGRKIGFTCDVCNRYFKKKHYLSAHMYQHTFVKSFSCDFCSGEFITLKEKKKHMKHHKTYSCDMCDMAFVHWSKYLRHKATHKEYHCDECGRRFNKRVHIVRHIKMHNKQAGFQNIMSVYKCSYENCDRAYSRNNNLKHHIKMVHLKAKYECEICQAKLSSKANLRVHLETHIKPRDVFLQPTKEMGRMIRCDIGAAKTSTALRIAGLVIDPENDSIRGTLKNISDPTNKGDVSLSGSSSSNLMHMLASTTTSQKVFIDQAMDQNESSYKEQTEDSKFEITESEQNDVIDLKQVITITVTEEEMPDTALEQNATDQSNYSNDEYKQKDIADLKTEENEVTCTASELTLKSYKAVNVNEKFEEPLETKQIFHETLKTDFKDLSVQQICKLNVS